MALNHHNDGAQDAPNNGHHPDMDQLSHTGKRSILSDVLGSYTGLSEDGTDPVQDADDL